MLRCLGIQLQRLSAVGIKSKLPVNKRDSSEKIQSSFTHLHVHPSKPYGFAFLGKCISTKVANRILNCNPDLKWNKNSKRLLFKEIHSICI